MHENCKKCKLHEGCNTPFMKSDGAKDPKILVVGEAPGAEEDSQGIPFVGRSGRLLRVALEDLLDDHSDDVVRFTNVVRCRPPDNKITARAINYCKHFAEDEIKQYKPDVVLLMGNSPLKAILGQTGITNLNGVVIDRDDTTYVPLFHPAYILRNRSATDDWLEGMDRALDRANGRVRDVKEKRVYIYPRSAWELLEMKEQLSESEWIAYDVETNTLDYSAKDARIVAISISDGKVTYAFPVEHYESYWTTADEKILKQVVQEVLESHDGRIIGHNIKFDLKHTLSYFGFGFLSGGDSMLASHLVDSRKGIHSLKRQAAKHLGMYDYDRELENYIHSHKEANPNRGGNYGNIPLDLLLPYAAMDADATFRLYKSLYEMLSPTQQAFYDEVLIPASDVLAHVEYQGIALDHYIAERYTTIYEWRQEHVYEDILKDPNVTKTVDLLQDKSDNNLMNSMFPYGGPIDKEHFKVSSAHISYNDEKKKRKRKRPIIVFNPNSTAHLNVLYFEVYKMPILSETKTGLPSTDKEAMLPLLDDYKILRLVRYYKILGKAVSTYLRPAFESWSSADGKVRTTFNLHGTVTGRPSSRDPNFQNIPTPDKEPGTLLEWLPVKNIFKTSFDPGAIISIDYSGMELRVFASVTDCETMLDIHRGGWDFHKMITSRITGIKYSDVPTSLRRKYKSVNFAMLYGGTEYTLYHKFGIPVDEGKQAIRDYNEELPEIARYKKECIKFAIDTGYIESVFGRREYLPNIGDESELNRGTRNQEIRQAVNMPIQSAASDVLLCALVILDDLMYERRLKARIINIVHDSIVIDSPADEVDEVILLCTDVMENVKKYALDYMPSLDFSWLKSPLKADVEIGTHYGTEVSYETWKEEHD